MWPERRWPEFKAVSVHVLTACGVVCALFALRATIAGASEQAFLWLGLAFFIDGIDGFFARLFDVKTVLPRFSGEIIDLCVDYVTYVFVPALMLLQSGYLSGAWGMAMAALICVTSLYHFSDHDSKAHDNSFVGFPAIWNIVAFYIFALALPDWATSVLIAACAGLTFVPLKWVHPMRVVAMRPATIAATSAWAAAAAGILWTGFPAHWTTAAVLVGVVCYGAWLSLYLGRDH